jgi:ribosomal protein L35
MPKNKPRKAMLKRIRFTKTGRVKHRRACGRHLRSHKPAGLLRRYRRPAYATGSEARRVRAMLFTRVTVNVERPPAKDEPTEER